MHDWITTTSLTVLTLMSLSASVLAIVWLGRTSVGSGFRKTQYSLIGSCTLGCVLLFVYRALVVHRGWLPLEAHVDGLLLVAGLFAIMVLFLQSRAHVRGLIPFALPVLTLILGWSVCASAWTFHLFEMGSVWMGVHLTGVYIGTLFFAIAGIAGSMYLYVQHQIRSKGGLRGGLKLANLEAIETLIMWMATSGFAFLSLGLATGVVIQVSGRGIGGHGVPGGSGGSGGLGGGVEWLFWAKIMLGFAAWLSYAIVMNARYAASFRGARAAWLSIAGLVLLLMTFGAVTALPSSRQPRDARTVAPEAGSPGCMGYGSRRRVPTNPDEAQICMGAVTETTIKDVTTCGSL